MYPRSDRGTPDDIHPGGLEAVAGVFNNMLPFENVDLPQRG
jgi:hypothetical protein